MANFIGQANFVPATMVEAAAGAATIDCLGLRLPLTCIEEPLAAGAAVTFVLRPEMIWIPEDRGGLQGLVLCALYLGDAIEYDVEIAGQRLTFTETNPLRMRVPATPLQP